MKTLSVYYSQQKIGNLTVADDLQYQFAYANEWLKADNAFPLSCSLPLTDKPSSHQIAYAFFSNLIPEGDLRDKLAKQLGLSEQNDFGLLEIIGGDVAGAISLYTEPEISFLLKTPASQNKLTLKQLDNNDLHFILNKLKTHPFLVNSAELNQGEKLRLSLAGAQNKLPIIYHNQLFSLPLGNTPSSHILKPDNEHIQGLVINEAFCMKLAKACGLAVAEIKLMQIIDQTILLVKRYDRANGERLHQEDFCQALGIVPFNKYESEGGPGFADCRKIIDKFSQRPAIDKKKLLQWSIFNYLIGNADAHAKNISLLYQANQNNPVLAPFYDLLSTAIYPSLSNKLSMKIGGENRPEWIMQRHWQRHCETLRISEKMLQREAIKITKIIKKKANHLLEEKPFSSQQKETLQAILEVIEKRVKHLEKQLNKPL